MGQGYADLTRILKLQGFNDKNEVTVTPGEDGRPRIGLISCYNILNRTGIDVSSITPLMMYGDHAAQPLYSIPQSAALVFNEISNPDLHTTALKRAVNFCERAKVPIINPPGKVQQFTRDTVSKTLQGIPGVTVPVTDSFKPQSTRDVFDHAISLGLDFPFIIRAAGDQIGWKTILVNSMDDGQYLHQYSFGEKDFYLTKHVDYSDHCGIFRIQRIIFIGGVPFARDVLFDRQWSVTEASRELMLQYPQHGVEADLVRKLADETIPRARTALLEIGRRIELDYFGLDCHIDPDGHVLVFKASANTNFLYSEVSGLEPQLQLISSRLRELVNRKTDFKFQ